MQIYYNIEPKHIIPDKWHPENSV